MKYNHLILRHLEFQHKVSLKIKILILISYLTKILTNHEQLFQVKAIKNSNPKKFKFTQNKGNLQNKEQDLMDLILYHKLKLIIEIGTKSTQKKFLSKSQTGQMLTNQFCFKLIDKLINKTMIMIMLFLT